MEKKLKFAIITDAHMGPAPWYFGANRIMSDETPRVLSELVAKINNEPGVEFVMQLGDLTQESIKAPSHQQDIQSLEAALQILSKLNKPLHHVIGNHELAVMSQDDLISRSGAPGPYYSFDVGNYKNIVLFSDSPGHTDILISADQVKWLEQELNDTDKDVLVFLHHQLAVHSLDDHYWFKGRPDKAFVKNADVVRRILEKSEKVRAVFNGHMHHTHFEEVNNIPYFTIESMVEDFQMNQTPSETYAIVEITPDGEITVDVRGRHASRMVYK